MRLLNVEIEINSRCNRKCSYCPVSIMPFPQVPRLIQENVLSAFIERLVEIDFDGRISFHFYNEPLIHKGLEDIIRRILAAVPKCRPVLFTNGDLLSQQRYDSLIEAGLQMIVITSHSGKSHPPRPRQVVQFSDDLVLTNRGGTMEDLPKATGEDISQRCFAPTEMLIVTITGDVVLCYEDAHRSHVMGNICEQSIDQIWNSHDYSRIRAALEVGNRKGACEMCTHCTNRAHTTVGMSDRSEPFWDLIS